MTESLVFVPRPGSELRNTIWPGSGIVGSQVADSDRLRIDFEGDAEVYPEFEDRVRRAAERHVHARPAGGQGYATKACAYVDPDVLIQIGRWQVEQRSLEIDQPEMLERWLGAL